MKASFATLVVILGTLALCPAQSEKDKKPLTNADVVEMVKGGLAESVIVTAIRSSPTEFDTSAPALIDLNKQHVSPKILEAMMSPKAPALPSPENGAQIGAAGAEAATAFMRVSFISAGATNEMLRTGCTQRVQPAISVFLPSKVFDVFNGAHAELRTKDPKPSFEVAIPGDVKPSDVIWLIKFKVKSDSREKIAMASGIGARGAAKEGIIPISLQEFAILNSLGTKTKIYRIQPEEPLKPGEYVLNSSGRYYDFGVDAAK